MRRRLLVSTLGVAFVAILLLGVPLGLVGARLIDDQARQRLDESAGRIAAEVDDRVEHGEPIDTRLARLVPTGRRVVVIDRSGRRYTVGPPPTVPQLTVTVPIPSGGRVSVSTARGPVDQRVMRAWLLVGGLIVVATGAAVGLAVVQGRRLLGPLDGLAIAAGRLGAGDTRPVGRRFGVPEIDRVAEVLDRSAERLGALLRREREFATDASHQLRTPLTALSIRLEEIAHAADDPRTVRSESDAALTQVERLTQVVDGLLARSRDLRSGHAERVDVAEVLAGQAREWEPAYRRAGRAIEVEARSGLVAAAAPGGFSQVVATLLDNALVHGAGTVTLRARPAADHVILEVADEGPGVPEPLVSRIFERSVTGGAGTGLGLTLARALVEADGGRLALVRARPPVFAVFLPVAGDAGAGAAPPRDVTADDVTATDDRAPDPVPAAGGDQSGPR